MGEIRHVKGCCPLDCQDTCAWVAEVEDGRATAVRGARDHPFTRGVLCAKVNDYPARTYAPDRLLHPLRRAGPKGSGRFERVSWDQAIGLIADRFGGIAARHGPEALLPHRYLGSMGVVQRRAPMRIFHALGASRLAGGICSVAAQAVAGEGFPLGFDPEDMAESRLVLLWGLNLLSTCHHHWHFVQEARRRHGARVVCLDPIRTRTARRCDEHVPLRPGTDAVLAAGMARIMLEEGLADLDFARGACADLDALAAEVAPWTPGRVATVCGIAPETVARLAREFAAARPAVIRAGVGPQQSAQGEAFVRAVHMLAILGGHWRHRGGGALVMATPGLEDMRADRADLIPAGAAPRALDMARLGETLTDPALDPPVKGLMVWGTNPAVVQPDAGRVRQGLAREDLFTVVLEHVLTDTARYADVVLPSTTQLEHFDVLGAWGHQYITVNLPAIAPLGEAKSHGEIMRLLARRLGLDHPAMRESDEAIAASALPPGVSLEALKEAGWVKMRKPPPRLEGAGLRLARGVSLPSAPPEGMLRLLTPKAHFFLNSSFVNQPRQRRAEGRPTLDMAPADAAARGLRDGEGVRLRNARGAIPATLRVTDAVPPGVVALPGKWWSLPEEEGAVANLLSPSAWSPGGQPAFNDTFVEVVGAGAAGR
ncbi:molybdopterin containing oxidoreductase [Caldovatus sediminis]|uniref:Molybdopterin containing oxidoreductase n=1 Tax=Caldovatus sediminis TaxID=2041189 RepID=A0A8J2Z888_9PROT|nr:molybdopterin-dependent oxidoreductase [Caldovatus sediminis]GGG21676.1 molybdopterin containing oxidoreductase [Caldovatus sediminis]